MSHSSISSGARRRLRPFAAALAFTALGAGVAHSSPLSAPAPAIPGGPTARAANDAYVKGVAALNEARLDEAAAAFRQSAAIDPKAPGPYLALAEIASRQGNDAGVK